MSGAGFGALLCGCGCDEEDELLEEVLAAGERGAEGVPEEGLVPGACGAADDGAGPGDRGAEGVRGPEGCGAWPAVDCGLAEPRGMLGALGRAPEERDNERVEAPWMKRFSIHAVLMPVIDCSSACETH